MKLAAKTEGLELWRFESPSEAQTFLAGEAVGGVEIRRAHSDEPWEFHFMERYASGEQNMAAVLVALRSDDQAEIGRLSFDAGVGKNAWIEVHQSARRHKYGRALLRAALVWFCGWAGVEEVVVDITSDRSARMARGVGPPLVRHRPNRTWGHAALGIGNGGAVSLPHGHTASDRMSSQERPRGGFTMQRGEMA